MSATEGASPQQQPPPPPPPPQQQQQQQQQSKGHSKKKEKAKEPDLGPAKNISTDPYLDAHCHLECILERANLPRTPESLQQIYSSGIFGPGLQGAITVCQAPESFDDYTALFAVPPPFPVWFCFGCHPHDASKYNDEVEAEIIRRITSNPRAVAWGEMGLDYHYDLSPRDVQRAVFARQLKGAIKLGKTILIHSREAEDDTMKIMTEVGIPEGWPIHLHCFTGQWAWAKQMLDRFKGMKLGLTGCCTFKSAQNLKEVAREIPIDRLVLETDGPFMAPEPHRGKLAHPGHIPTVAAVISSQRTDGLSQSDVQRICLENTKALYKFS